MKARRIAAAGATLFAATVMTLSIPGQVFAATYSLDGQNPVSAGCAADATTNPAVASVAAASTLAEMGDLMRDSLELTRTHPARARMNES